jgi:hypothetical protein
MSLNLQTRPGYEVKVVQVDASSLVMTVSVTNSEGKASGRHTFNLATIPGIDPSLVCRDAYPIAFEEPTP